MQGATQSSQSVLDQLVQRAIAELLVLTLKVRARRLRTRTDGLKMKASKLHQFDTTKYRFRMR
jgi:hypothetical protein